MTIQKIGFIIGLGVLAIDQLTKALILNIDALDNGVTVLPFFNIVRLKNNGISFGLLGSLPPWLLTLAALSIVAVLFYWLWRTADRQIATALGLITGGALGNIVDRVRHGAVTDFLDFHINNYHWPAFNFADSAIVCGVGYRYSLTEKATLMSARFGCFHVMTPSGTRP